MSGHGIAAAVLPCVTVVYAVCIINSTVQNIYHGNHRQCTGNVVNVGSRSG